MANSVSSLKSKGMKATNPTNGTDPLIKKEVKQIAPGGDGWEKERHTRGCGANEGHAEKEEM